MTRGAGLTVVAGGSSARRGSWSWRRSPSTVVWLVDRPRCGRTRRSRSPSTTRSTTSASPATWPHGHGSTFDGIDPTNGYHPLWMLIAVPFFWAGLDGTGAARALLALQVLFYGGALVLVALTAGRAVGRWERLRAAEDGTGRGDEAARWCTWLVAGALVLVGGQPLLRQDLRQRARVGRARAARRHPALAGRPATAAMAHPGFVRRPVVGGAAAVADRARPHRLGAAAGSLGLWTLAEARPLGRRAIRPLLELFALPAVTLGAYLLSNQVMFGVTLQISGMVKRAPLTPGRAVTMGLVVVASPWRIGRLGWVAQRPPDQGPRSVPPVGALRGLDRVVRRLLPRPGRLLPGAADPAVALVLLRRSPCTCCSCWCSAWRTSSRRPRCEAPKDGRWPRALAPVVAILFAPLLVALWSPVEDLRRPRPPIDRDGEPATPASGSTRTCPTTPCSHRGTPAWSATTPDGRSSTSTGSRTRWSTTTPGGTGPSAAFLADRGSDRHRQPRDPGRRARSGDRRVHRRAWGPDDGRCRDGGRSPGRSGSAANTVGGAGPGRGRSMLAVFLYSLEPPRSSG